MKILYFLDSHSVLHGKHFSIFVLHLVTKNCSDNFTHYHRVGIMDFAGLTCDGLWNRLRESDYGGPEGKMVRGQNNLVGSGPP